MSYMPTSSPGIALAQLRRMVALSAAFQAGVGAVDTADAVNFAPIGQQPYTNLPDGGAIIYLADGPVMWEMQAGGQQLWLHPVGVIICQLILKQTDELEPEERYLHGIDFVGNVADDVKALSGAEDTDSEFAENHLDITRLAVEYAGQADPRHDASRGKLFLAKLFIDWGIK